MESITKLFGDLCEAHLAGVSKKTHLGREKICKRRRKECLKRIAYNTLFANLFLDEARKAHGSVPTLPVKNKMLMLSFNLRVAGSGQEADRLEELLDRLETATCLPFTEIDSVLDLLVQLAGTGPPQRLPPKRDYFVNNKYVGRNVKYQGYDYYDVSMFETDIRISIEHEEHQCNDTIQKTLQIMEAAPGTGLPTVELFSRNCPVGDRFERETRVSLFGALVHSRTYDMDIKLDLPPVPDNADLSGLAIKVPQSIDPSEDEGFQSASNLTPDSQSEPSVTPDIDLWEAALTYGPSKRRCWERIGCPPGKKEEPYLSEAGREAFDKFCRLREGELQLFSSKFQLPQRVLIKEPELVKDVLNVLIGVVSTSFSFDQAAQMFVVKQGIYVSGTSPESMNALLSEMALHGTYYTRLSRFSVEPVLDSSYNKGLVFQAYTSGLRKYLQYYRACVLSTPPTLTLLTISFLFGKLGRQLRYLAALCGIGVSAMGIEGGAAASFPTGVKLLSYLYQEALNNCSNEHYPVLLSLLKTSCEPYTRFVHDWVYSGVFRDVYGEFMIQVNEDYLGCRDQHYWTDGYILISEEVEDCVPVFLKHIANEVYICGKTINLLKLCCPRHYICWSDIPVPRIAVIFSLEELKEIERDCAVYVGRMERIARYSAISKEEKDLRMEIEKQELIVHARETANKALKVITDRQISDKMALDAKKRQQFQRLKEQFAKDLERRRALKQEEIDDDFSYARELREREQRLKALEEDMEKKARQELIDHYSKLSEDAARREKKALWKIQRHKLETARLKFLLEDQKRIEDMLEKLPGGTYRKKVDILPEYQGQQLSPTIAPVRESNLQVPSVGPDVVDTDRAMEFGLASESVDDERGESALSINRTPHACLESQEAGTTSSVPCTEQAVSQLESSPELGLEFEDFLPKPQEETIVAPSVEETTLLDEALQNINSDLSLTDQTGENHLLPKDAGEREPSTQVDLPGDYDFNTVLRPLVSPSHTEVEENVEGRRPRWKIHGHASDANIKIGEYVPHGELSRPLSNPHGHSSDAHIKIGEYAPEVERSRPRWSVHGHVSAAHIQIGEYISEVQPSRPRWNIHGHASDANIKIGEYVSEVEPVRPWWNVHGHSSDANIRIGENVSEVVPSRPRWNIHGHVSHSHIKIGELVSDTSDAKPRWSRFGHASQSSIQIGEWTPSAETDPIPHQKAVSGPASSSTVQTLLYSAEFCITKENDKEQQDCRKKVLPQSRPLADIPDEAEESGLAEEDRPDDAGDLPLHSPPNIQVEEPEESTELVPIIQQISISETDATESQEGGPTTIAKWRKEEDYLKSLSDQYCLEKYQDSYELMSELPVSHLLHHVIPRSYTFPVDPSVQSATDETAIQLSELLSLPVLMKRSITAPLVSHVSLVNKAIVDYYFVELNVEKHFEALRHFLLMEDGEFAQSLSDLLFEKLGSAQTPGDLLNPLVLNSILNKALQYSLHGDTQLASNLSFALKYLPEDFQPNALNCLELRYKVDWPLNIVITENCINTYNKIFSFLLQLKHMMWTLKDVWFHLKRSALVKNASNSVQFRQLQLYKHEMQHFVKVIQGYIANQILHVTWCEFGNELSSVGNLEDICRTHEGYLEKAIFRGLLTDNAAPMMNIIHSIFGFILTFRSQLISQSWSFDASKQMAIHPNFGLMQLSYNNFKFYSRFLFLVVNKLVNRGFQPHLEDFVLRLNFNNYYQIN